MKIFLNENREREFKAFTDKTESLIDSLEGFGNTADIEELKRLVKNFKIKTKDFFDENRKLNIGVVGQVKAGKSSFLNTLLFDGKEVLPKASTPKTAALTKMEYSEENIINVEYYTPDDWKSVENQAESDSESDVAKTARELKKMARDRGLNPAEILSRGSEILRFNTYDGLVSRLNDYVGENGRYTPFVKAVTLKLNKEEFKGISIVDTPGLNDPIMSRTERTKDFIEVCDVVFFLSPSYSFLDISDWQLLSAQLPQKGVKRLVLIVSKYDSGVRDVLKKQVKNSPFSRNGSSSNSTDNVPAACEMVSRKLKKRAKQKILEFEEELKMREKPEELINVVRECANPIMVSAMSYNMINKSPDEYDREEKQLYDKISDFSRDIQEDLKLMGNMDAVRKLFDEVAAEKENIMEEKSRNFVPDAETELKDKLISFKDKASKRVKILSDNDREKLLQQKNTVEAQINNIRADIITAFGEWTSRLESEKAKTIREIRNYSKYSSVDERTGTRSHEESYTTYDHHFLFIKWGRRTRYYTVTENYTYLAAADAADNLRSYVLNSTNSIEEIFSKTVNHKEMKRKLLNIVSDNFDMGSESFDAGFFKIIVEGVVNKIEFPVIKIETSGMVDSLISGFSGEITSSSDKDRLRTALSNALDNFFNMAVSQIEISVRDFKSRINNICGSFEKDLLENINNEFNSLAAQFNDKEKEISNYQNYISELEGALKKIYYKKIPSHY
ncbi:MAG: dynamin family protein [Clostridiales bacterium]|nr:dynamin family protein [Clostridiales bacterium]